MLAQIHSFMFSNCFIQVRAMMDMRAVLGTLGWRVLPKWDASPLSICMFVLTMKGNQRTWRKPA